MCSSWTNRQVKTMKSDKVRLGCTHDSTQTIYIPDPRLSVHLVLISCVLPTTARLTVANMALHCCPQCLLLSLRASVSLDLYIFLSLRTQSSWMRGGSSVLQLQTHEFKQTVTAAHVPGLSLTLIKYEIQSTNLSWNAWIEGVRTSSFWFLKMFYLLSERPLNF